MLKTPDLVIFMMTTTTDKTDYFTPCTWARGNKPQVDTGNLLKEVLATPADGCIEVFDKSWRRAIQYYVVDVHPE